MRQNANNTGNRVITVILDDDPHRIFEDQRELPTEQRAGSLLIDARSATAEDVKQWLDRCESIPGFMEGTAAEWLIEHVTVLSNASEPEHSQGIHWIQTETNHDLRRIASFSSVLSPEDAVEDFLAEQQNLAPEQRSSTVYFDARRIGMESIERWIGFFYQFCDAHAEKVEGGIYEPETIVVISEHEQPEEFSGIQQLRWIKTTTVSTT